ncbi:hypothetical protein EYF80_053498 [Liparis tanakae]|uniref:Uncharacterized protein n=1 Tax=Liparis tanakae TaxID=230148 RepID=A0A4Z2F666_9TELE|nr:hypothetical protein EYF80_053498 [Liparis tanakae]
MDDTGPPRGGQGSLCTVVGSSAAPVAFSTQIFGSTQRPCGSGNNPSPSTAASLYTPPTPHLRKRRMKMIQFTVVQKQQPASRLDEEPGAALNQPGRHRKHSEVYTPCGVHDELQRRKETLSEKDNKQCG